MFGPLLVAALLGGAAEIPLAARVEAQRDIERARYAFVIGNSRPFDELYDRSLFEARVARQVAEEEVLQRAFGMVVTPALLAEEFDRVEKTTRAPEQWEAIKKALGNDRRRVEEAFCRPSLVERALRARFAFDQKVHAEPHEKARQARAAFIAKQAVPGARVHLLRRRAEAPPSVDQLMEKAKAGATGPRVLQPAKEPDPKAPLPLLPEIAAVLERELKRPGDVTTILEESDQFSVFRLIEASGDTWKVDAVRFPKLDFDTWFSRVRDEAAGVDRRERRRYAFRMPSQPLRYSGRLMNGAASGALRARRFWWSHSIFFPVR